MAASSPAAATTREPQHGLNRKLGLPVRVVQTTADLRQRLSRNRGLRFGALGTRGLPVLHVDDHVRYQRITGFGAAMTDTSAWLIHDQLSQANRAGLMRALFGPSGIRLDFVRVPIGASDFTAAGRPYTYDDLPAGESDPQLLDFSIAHDYAYILPTLLEAVHIDPRVEILATPWSPPSWMKANQAFDNFHKAGTLLPAAYRPLANYVVKFIEAYDDHGLRPSQ
jgi:glucosylceramidase